MWQLTLLLAGMLYSAADLFFELEFPLLGVTIILILARELARSHTPRRWCPPRYGIASFDGTRLSKQASQRFCLVGEKRKGKKGMEI